MLIGLKLDELAKKYKVKHDDPLPTTIPVEHWTQGENLDLATYERKYLQKDCLTKELGFQIKTM